MMYRAGFVQRLSVQFNGLVVLLRNWAYRIDLERFIFLLPMDVKEQSYAHSIRSSKQATSLSTD